MKTSKLLFLVIVVFFSRPIKAQKITWFNVDWVVVPKKEAVYYRVEPKKIKRGYLLTDYYLNGVKKREGVSKVYYPNEEYYIDVVKTYFETGNLHTRVRYKEGLRNGIWREYYKNGKIKERGKYRVGKKVGVWKIFYKNSYK